MTMVTKALRFKSAILWTVVSLMNFNVHAQEDLLNISTDEFVPQQRASNQSQLYETQEPNLSGFKGTQDYERISSYHTDTCRQRDRYVENESRLRNLNMRRCKDGTVSFVQPDSEGIGGWEGKCGQVAASNLLFMFCKVAAHPKRYADHYLSDITPGVRPGVLAEGLTDMFKKNWRNCPSDTWETVSFKNSNSYYNAIESALADTTSYSVERTRKDGSKLLRSPIAALIRPPRGKSLHWVTIVDMINPRTSSCKLIVNQWDDQYEIPCYTFAKWSYGVWDSFGPVLKAYTIIRRN